MDSSWQTVTFKVTTLPLPFLKKERSYRYSYFKKQVVIHFALQTIPLLL